MWQNMLGWASHSLPYLPFPCVQNIKKMENYQKVLPPKDKVSVPLGLRASLPVLSLSLSDSVCIFTLWSLLFLFPHSPAWLLAFTTVSQFLSSCLNGYQPRVLAPADDRKNRAVHGVHDPAFHPQAFSATGLRFAQKDRLSASCAASAATVQ